MRWSTRCVEGDATLRYRVIASLNKLKRLHPEVIIDPSLVELLLTAEIAGHYRSHQVLGALRRTLLDDDPMFVAMAASMEHERERIFRLMSLLYPDVDLQDAYVGLESSDPTIRANALEFLDNVLPPHLREVLVPVLDPQTSLEDRIAIADRLVGAPRDHRRSRHREHCCPTRRCTRSRPKRSSASSSEAERRRKLPSPRQATWGSGCKAVPQCSMRMVASRLLAVAAAASSGLR